jgi:hypothetical protein
LTGTLPAEFANLGRLEELTASHNLLTGKIEYLFNRTTDAGLGQLEYFDLSDNAFSGTIPESMFVGARFRPLSTVVLYQNCFTGSLPAAVCQAGNLTTIILDSVSSAPACDVRFTGLWKDLFKVVIGKRSLHGTIPDCIWSMRSLQTVHLAGSGLGGSLPGDMLMPVITTAADTNLSSDDSSVASQRVYVLNDVNLASNTLAGTLPLSWQQWPWKSLDLSGNKFTGILSEGFVINNTCTVSKEDRQADDDYYAYYDDGGSSSPSAGTNTSQPCGNIDLTVNRLSGRIPGVFRYAPAINILDGNLFDCDGNTMPESDPMAVEYVCGSSDFNNSLILWICIFVFSVAVIASISRTKLFTEARCVLSSPVVGIETLLWPVKLSVNNAGSISRFLTFLVALLLRRLFYKACICAFV